MTKTMDNHDWFANEYIDIFRVIDHEAVQMPRFCDSNNFSHWENETATPKLKEKGYQVRGWFDGERDSFGPLSRYCVAIKDGQQFRFIYG